MTDEEDFETLVKGLLRVTEPTKVNIEGDTAYFLRYRSRRIFLTEEAYRDMMEEIEKEKP